MGEKSVVSWTVVLGGVVKWEGFENARLLFDKMPERNEVAWTVMIAAYIENGLTKEAFGLLREMLFESGFELNFVTLSSLLSACAQSGNVLVGKWVHVYALKMIEHEIDIVVATTLINMYAKCGRIDDAFRVFLVMPRRNVITWNAMLSGLAMQGKGDMVLDLFGQMIREVKPDDVTFTAILSACSHSGLVDQGRHFFYSLESTYGIKPSIEHYSCVVDLLGRAGYLEEAESIMMLDEMIQKIRLAGYAPDTTCQKFSGSNDGDYYGYDQEEKEQALFSHSEKLAVCFGLISTQAGMPLYIFKNLRICQDCHSAMKVVSKVYNREIVIRDRNRFHRFKLGSCSCFDYW